MAYTATVWANDVPPPLSAANLNKLVDELRAEALVHGIANGLPTWVDGASPAITDAAPLNEIERVTQLVAQARGMVYVPTTWSGGWTPARNAANFNRIEQQLVANSLWVPTPPAVTIPTFRTSVPPNQAAPTTTGFKGFLNAASKGANCPLVYPLSSPQNVRWIDCYTHPEWWLAWSQMMPAQAPWTTTGVPNFCNYPLNFHATPLSAAWGAGSGGGAGWGFAFVSSILMFTAYPAPVGGNRPVRIAIHQEDGETHHDILLPFTLTHGVWHHFLAHIVWGLSSAARWNNVVNPSPTRRIGKVEIWKDAAIANAPNSPTWEMDPVGTLRGGVDPANGQRYAQRAIEIYEAQLYTPSYTESALHPNTVTFHANYRTVRMGQTLAACLAEVPQFTIIADKSTWQGHVNKGGTGQNFGDAERTVITDPGGYPV